MVATTRKFGRTETKNLSDAANLLLDDSKKTANALYEEGLAKLSSYEKDIKMYSDKILDKVKQKPLSSVLIAAGVGFLLSKIIK